MKNRANFIPPPTNQICNYPKELYVIDLTTLPYALINNENDNFYLLSIIHFSKFASNYILKNKSGDKKFKTFIQKYGVPNQILTDNRKEFSNKTFIKFCKKQDIEILQGRPRYQ